MGLLNNRSSMVLFQNEIGHRSQKIRMVLSEKGIACDFESLDPNNIPSEILDVNPSGNLPLLIDRELSLYHSGLIVEYLDERFPHPPLLPVYPVARAQTRLILHRLEADWCKPMDTIEEESSSKNEKNKSKKELETNLNNSLSLFNNQNFFRSDELTVLDTVIMPILFRLSFYEIKISSSKAAKPLNEYMERMRDYKSFTDSITESERELLI